jgi:hypothetical protein
MRDDNSNIAIAACGYQGPQDDELASFMNKYTVVREPSNQGGNIGLAACSLKESLSNEERVVCEALGISEEEYFEQRKSDMEEAMRNESEAVSQEEISELMGITYEHKNHD